MLGSERGQGNKCSKLENKNKYFIIYYDFVLSIHILSARILKSKSQRLNRK